MALHAHLLHLVMILSLVNSVRVRETAQHKISTEVAILTNVPKGFPPKLVQMSSDVSFVAEGGFGKVFKGTLKSTGLVHAIKVPKNAMNLEHKCRVIEPIHAMVRQQSGPTFTHIMNCLGSSNTDKYMILEWSGVDGYEAIVSCSFNKAMGLFKQLLIGLVSLHRSNPFPVIVHHDLKWQNVGVDEKNSLRIIDLEDTLPGYWGKRINGAQGYTFSTPETANNKFGFFCGLQPSRSYPPDTLCPFAWTFDAYTAGIMAIQLFGVDLFFYLKYYRSVGAGHLQDHLAHKSVLYIPSIMVNIGLKQFMQGQDKKFVQELQSSDIDSMYLRTQEALAAQYLHSRKVALPPERLRKAFATVNMKMQRLKEFKALDSQSLTVLEGMLSPNPEHRSSAENVLVTSAFLNRQTGCPNDVPDEDPIFQVHKRKKQNFLMRFVNKLVPKSAK